MKNFLLYIVLTIVAAAWFGGRYLYFKPKYDDGEKAPAFTAELIDGSSFSLDQLRGQYVLVDFWGSWCGPCRRENPGLVRLYHKYREAKFKDANGFAIVSVALESNPTAWKAAIQKDGLAWPYHIGQFDRFKSPVAKLYGVREIPTKYLIGPQGNIISVNPTFEEVETMMGAR